MMNRLAARGVRWLRRCCRAPTLALLSGLVAACGPVVPEHVVRVESNCPATPSAASFRFAGTDFELSCSGGILSGSCSGGYENGVYIGGDDFVLRIQMYGFEDVGRLFYRAMVRPEPGQLSTNDRPEIECDVHHHDDDPSTSELGQWVDCYFATPVCQVRITQVGD